MKKKIQHTAKLLFKLSIIKDELDETRISTILKTLVKQKPLHYIRILESYKNLIEKFLGSKQIIVEVPKGFNTQKVTLKTEKQVIVKENKNIVFGVRVTNSDWVYDNTLEANLKSLVH